MKAGPAFFLEYRGSSDDALRAGRSGASKRHQVVDVTGLDREDRMVTGRVLEERESEPFGRMVGGRRRPTDWSSQTERREATSW